MASSTGRLPIVHCLNKVVLSVHPRGDPVTSALKHHAACGRKVDADVRAVQLFLDDERGISDEVQRLLLAEMLIVIRAAGAEQMRRSRVLVKSSRDAPMTAILGA